MHTGFHWIVLQKYAYLLYLHSVAMARYKWVITAVMILHKNLATRDCRISFRVCFTIVALLCDQVVVELMHIALDATVAVAPDDIGKMKTGPTVSMMLYTSPSSSSWPSRALRT